MSRDAIPRENLGVHKDRDINLFMCRSEARTAMLHASLTVIARAIAWAKAVSPETVEFEEGDKLYQALDALCRSTGPFYIADMGRSPGSQPLPP